MSSYGHPKVWLKLNITIVTFLQFILTKVYLGAAKKSYKTKQNLSKKLIEEALSAWFGNARYRGKDGRKERSIKHRMQIKFECSIKHRKEHIECT